MSALAPASRPEPPPHAPPPPDAPLAMLEPWIVRRLHPLQEGWPSRDRTSAERIGGDLHEAGAALSPPPQAGGFARAAVLVGLTERPHGVSLILTRRADTLQRHSGQVALPGGRTEPGETPWAAAIREAQEEIGLDPAFVRPLALGDRYRTVTGFEITPVMATVKPGFTLEPSIDEVAEVFETPFAFLMDPANHEERLWDSPSGRRRYYAMTHGERLIWGATAGMLRALWARLFGLEARDAG